MSNSTPRRRNLNSDTMKPHTDPHAIAARLTEELRALYRDHNDGPRLIAEMVTSEFPEAAKLVLGLTDYVETEAENVRLRERVKLLEEEIDAIREDEDD